MSDPHVRPELLAPAGDWTCLEAALEAGADSIYFGLTALNARARAKNFDQDEFVRAVETVHARGAKAYLTLNVDLTERELGQAARILELARQCRVDAVLVRDPALLALHPLFPELPFHFSTQTCMAGSADVSAARQLGIARVVLAREMSLTEIAAASSVSDVETEVFVQGALCYCVSGRCLLSSWAGGRSGNRGACTSPCRVPWTAAGQALGTPLSMRDLGALDRLDHLRRAGVAALKIEGRLKNAAWVRQAVGLYRRVLDGEPAGPLLEELGQLGAYTGRALTSAYLDGQRDELTGLSGRAPAAQDACDAAEPECAAEPTAESPAAEPAGPTYEFHMEVGPREITCRCVCNGQTIEWPMTKTVVHRQKKAVAIGDVLDGLLASPIQGCTLSQATTDDPEFLLVPRAVNALWDKIRVAIRQATKEPDGLVRVDLPEAVRTALEKARPHRANRLHLGDAPNRVRCDANSLTLVMRNVRPSTVIVEGVTPGRFDKLRQACGDARMIVALPAVFFDDAIPALKELVQQCAAAELSVEVNSWGGWHLARKARVRMEGGPGLGVLNALAARALAQHGLECVTLSIEADRRQLEDATAACSVPCSLVVFGRPPLMTTRVKVDDSLRERVLADRREVQIIARPERGLTVFRPVQPFDLRGTKNERIGVANLVVDLIGADDPVGDWYNEPSSSQVFRFNYDRSLA